MGPGAVSPVCAVLVLAGALALIAARVRRMAPVAAPSAWRHGTLWVVIGLVISLPAVGYWGSTRVELPQAFAGHWLPIADFLRDPTRLGVDCLLGWAILSGLAFAECARWLTPARALVAQVARLALAALVVTAMYVHYVRGALLPGSEVRVLPAAYPSAPAIGADSPIVTVLRETDGPLLELPVGLLSLASFFRHHTVAMYRSIYHWRPLLNGYSSYWPKGFDARMALARRLPDARALAELRGETGLATILVHTGDWLLKDPLPPHPVSRLTVAAERAQLARWLRIAANGGRDDLRLLVRDGDDLLFAVALPDEGAAVPPSP